MALAELDAEYIPVFGNDLKSEALPVAVPQGRNSPQRMNYELRGSSV